MNDQFLIHTLIIMAGIESKQPGAMPLEDNTLFVAANRLKELQALKAQVEQLRNAGQALREPWDLNNILGAEIRRLVLAWDKVYSATPAQCLAEIKAQAVADAVNAYPEKIAYIEHCGQTRSRGDYCDLWLSCSDLIQYANKLRQQAEAGE